MSFWSDPVGSVSNTVSNAFGGDVNSILDMGTFGAWGAVGAPIVGGISDTLTNKKGREAAAAAAAKMQAASNYAKGNLDPYASAGKTSINRMQELLSNPNSYQESAYNKWLTNQGNQAIERSAAAKGMLNSGNVLTELAKYSQDMAGKGFNDYYDKWAGMAGGGQSAATAQGNIELQNAAQQGNAAMQIANMENAPWNSLYNAALGAGAMYLGGGSATNGWGGGGSGNALTNLFSGGGIGAGGGNPYTGSPTTSSNPYSLGGSGRSGYGYSGTWTN